jgi:hypothetical protein
VPTRQLVAEVKALPDGDVTLTATTTQLQLRSGNRTATIMSMGRLPDVTDVPASSWQPLSSADAATLGHAIAVVAPAAVIDPARPAVAGVRLEVDATSQQLHVVATDGARLHCRAVTLTTTLPRNLTLPNAVVGAITSLLGRGEVAAKPTTAAAKKRGSGAAVPITATPVPPSFTLAVGVNNIALRSVDAMTTTTLYARLAPEPYAPWRRIADGLGAAIAVAVTLDDVAALSSWLRSCPADAVTLSAYAGVLRLSYDVTDDTGTRRLGGGEDSIAAATSVVVPPCPVKLSVRYLRDVLVGCAGDVVLSWSSGQPVRVTSVGQLVGVVMWMR